MLSVRDKKGFEIMCPVGYEKLIPVSVDEASAFIADKKDYSMGQKVRLRTLDATVVTETDAIRMLADVEAMVFAAGGLEGAAGTICMAIKGEDGEVEKAGTGLRICKRNDDSQGAYARLYRMRTRDVFHGWNKKTLGKGKIEKLLCVSMDHAAQSMICNGR